jgi:hypothetical protein
LFPTLAFLFLIIKRSLAHNFVKDFVDSMKGRNGISTASIPSVVVVPSFVQHQLLCVLIPPTHIGSNIRLKGQIFEPML